MILLASGESKAIEELRVGDRVAITEENRIEAKEGEERIEEAEELWEIRVRIPAASGKPDDEGEVTLLRSSNWLRDNYEMRTHSLRLALLESDTIGRFRILSLRRVAKPAKGPGGLVTGSMSLSSAKVCELRLRDSSGNSTTLRVTGNHPFWSLDRQAWVPLNALRIGERLVQRSGVEACVESLRRLSGRWRVYNVEVEGAHCYFAGDWAVLVHNNTNKANDPACRIGLSRREQTERDVTLPTERAARREALRRWDARSLSQSDYELIPDPNPNKVIRGPNFEPAELVRVNTRSGKIVEFQHHKWGHTFQDKSPNYEIGHFHGPDGEHISYER
jgi:hypothetical protein